MEELLGGISQSFAGRYRLTKLLGKGGMGTVYLAEDTILHGEKVAIKILNQDLTDDPQHTERFLREVQLTRRVTHPNIVRTFDVGRAENHLFFSMEYVEGITLRDLIKKAPLSAARAIPIILDIARGLSAIHDAEIVHRDLKPRNVIICSDGTIKIADFGVARPSASEVTSAGEVVGSIAYMAPEVWRGESSGPLSDIYALGILSYQMLTGKLPFNADSPAQMMCKHLDETAKAIIELNPDLPAWLIHLTNRMMGKSENDRPQSAREIIQIIDRQLSGTTTSSIIPLHAPKTPGTEAPKTPAAKLLDDEDAKILLSVDELFGASLAPESVIDGSNPSILTSLNPHTRIAPGTIAPRIARETVLARHSGVIETSPNKSSRALILNLSLGVSITVGFGALMLAFLIYGIEPLQEVLGKRSAMTKELFSSLVYLIAYPILITLPILPCAALRNGAREGARAWLRSYFGVTCLTFVLALYNMLWLAITGLSSVRLQISFESACRSAIHNVFEIFNFLLIGSPFTPVELYKVRTLAPGSKLALVWVLGYGLAWLGVVALMTLIVRQNILKLERPNRRVLSISILSITAYAATTSLLYELIPISRLYSVLISDATKMAIGPGLIKIDPSLFAIGAINWCVVFFVIGFVIPSWIRRNQRKFKGVQ